MAKSSVWSVFLVFAFKAKEDCFDSTKMGDSSYKRCLLGNYSDDSLSFLRLVYSKKNLESEITLLKELKCLQNEFTVCKDIREKKVISNKAIGLLERLAESEEILKDKKLRASFEVFLMKTLLFLEFDQNDITEFIAGLNLNGKLRHGYLKAKECGHFSFKVAAGILAIIYVISHCSKTVIDIHYMIEQNFFEKLCKFCKAFFKRSG